MMTDRPIIFSAPMINALLDGRKTQTRRILKDAPAPTANMFCDRVGPTGFQWTGEFGLPRLPFTPPYAICDRLWVKETWAVGACADSLKPRELHPGTWLRDNGGLWYRADNAEPATPISPRGRTRTGRFMPRWASRVTLIVENVRVQRLLDISEDDAIAEGFADGPIGDPMPERDIGDGWTVSSPGGWASAAGHFQILWAKLHPDWDGYSSPWVVALTFRLIKANIDSPEAK